MTATQTNGHSGPVDPVTRQLIRGSLRAARLECELIIERTAMSAFIREKKDYTVSFLDGKGQEVYGETMGSDILGCVWAYYPAESMRPGDLYWYNDPYISQGSITHTPDMVFIAPVFYEGDVVAYCHSFAHFWDLGGSRPGSIGPANTEKKDYTVSFLDGKGQEVYGETMGSDILGCVWAYYPAESMRPGDLYWYNDPYISQGSITHTPDMVFIAPVFYEGDVVAYCHSFAHFWDLGGSRPGSIGPANTEIFHDGTLVPPIKIVNQGILNDEAYRIILRNPVPRPSGGRLQGVDGRSSTRSGKAPGDVRPLRQSDDVGRNRAGPGRHGKVSAG